MHSTVVTSGDKITTSTKMQLDLKRGPIALAISMESSFIETADGKPISMTAVKKMGATPIVETYTFKPDGSLELTSRQGDAAPHVTQVPKPDGEWLAPAAADRYVTEKFKSGAKEIKVRSIDPLEGATPVDSTRTGFDKSTIDIGGRKLEVVKVAVETSAAPGVKSTEYDDSEGELVKSETQMGGLSVVMTATTREKALADAPAPEIMVNTFIKPSAPINNPRETKRTVLLLSVPDDQFPSIPTTGSQRVEAVDAKSVRLTITSKNPGPASDADPKDPALLKGTAMANTEDPAVKELAKRAVEKAGDDPAAKAEACRRFVHRFITKKDLGVGFASASEVAKTKEGDCTEHGVLLTALLRANGIPARAVTGLLYVDEFEGSSGIFGYHMWAQALLTIDGKPRWVDLDATLPKDTPFDATHITLGTTDLADGESTGNLASIAPLLGRLSIKVESVE
jgi:hypothetical protein